MSDEANLIQYRNTNFRPETLRLIGQMERIVAEYAAAGHRMTARQLYYQLVTQNVVPNTEQSYKRVTNTLTDARYAAIIPWDAIEDRGRPVSAPGEWPSIKALAEVIPGAFRLPRWDAQPNYCELWVEKQALAGVLEPCSRRHHVPLMVNKGYSSASAMKESADRFIANTQPEHLRAEIDEEMDTAREEARGNSADLVDEVKMLSEAAFAEPVKDSYLFYLGDFDPSGEDMVRDIEARLCEFGVLKLCMVKIALTREQIDHFNPPPNPAKMSDSRAAKFVAEHGASSWEVDALPPDVLVGIIDTAINGVTDSGILTDVKVEEERQKEAFRKHLKKFKP